MEAVETGAAVAIVFTELDRLGRGVTAQEAALGAFWTHGALVITTEQHGDSNGIVTKDDPLDPMRTAMREVMAVFSKLEKGMIRARMERGRGAKAERGGYTCGAPRFGLRAEAGELATDPAEQAVQIRIITEHQAGQSIRAICRGLNDDGLTAKRGGAWHPTAVARVIEQSSRCTGVQTGHPRPSSHPGNEPFSERRPMATATGTA